LNEAGRAPSDPLRDPLRDPAERLDRSRARAWVLQVHYRWESERSKDSATQPRTHAPAQSAKGSFEQALRNIVATRRVSPRRLPYVRKVVAVLDARLADIDAALREALDNWRLERLSAIDRAVLRIGAAEMLYVDEVPPKVAIQEAIRLAESYGGDESPRFVNGVLDALYKRRAQRPEGGPTP
jgi:N utilization substance protein B